MPAPYGAGNNFLSRSCLVAGARQRPPGGDPGTPGGPGYPLGGPLGGRWRAPAALQLLLCKFLPAPQGAGMKGGCGSSFFLVLVRSFCLSFFPSSRPSPCVCPSVFAVSCLCLPFIMSSLSSLLWFPVSFIQCSLCLVFVFPFPFPLCLSLLLFPVSFLVFPVSCLCLPFCVSCLSPLLCFPLSFLLGSIFLVFLYFLLYPTLLYFTLLYSALLCSTLLYSTLLYSTLLYFT